LTKIGKKDILTYRKFLKNLFQKIVFFFWESYFEKFIPKYISYIPKIAFKKNSIYHLYEE